MGKIENLIGFRKNIEKISIDKIELNTLNPRERFVESEEDQLIESIISKGILNPIIVFEKKDNGKYVLLDGERRFRACKKLNIEKIPAYILKRKPNSIENLSMMFHIHNVREEWTEFAVSISIKRIIDEMVGKNVRNLQASDIKELSKITSLTDYKIRKYLKFQDYPQKVIDKFLDAEKKEKYDKGLDPDILSEMHKPIKQMESLMPEIFEKYSVEKIIDVCIKKKSTEKIKNNKEFRLLSKAFTAVKRGEIRKEVLKDKIIDFITEDDVTPEKIYSDTAETIYKVKSITRNSENLYEEINNLNLNKLTTNEKELLRQTLKKLTRVIEIKLMN